MARTRACAILAALGALAGACGARAACDGVACAAACPRDAARDPTGRCACAPGHVLVLGACVPPAVGDAYCGRAAKAGVDGCVFRACAEREVLDAATGACLPKTTIEAASAIACADGGALVVADGHAACVAAEAACPRGTRRAGAVCPRPPKCPPGALASEGRCEPVVTIGVRSDVPRVDLGSWTAVVLGADGGPGKPDLCRPLAMRPDAFGLSPGTTGTVTLRIAIAAPDQDMTRLHAHTQAQLTTPESTLPAPAPAASAAIAIVEEAVATLIEPLRGLGGEASTAIVVVEVTCRVSSL